MLRKNEISLHRLPVRFAVGLLAAICAACSTPEKVRCAASGRGDDDILVPDVPYVRQVRGGCAAASLESLALYVDGGINVSDLQRRMPIVGKRGVPVLDLLGAARQIGLDVDVVEGSMEKLTDNLASRSPVCVMLDVSRPWALWRSARYHFVIVTGLSPKDESVRLNDGRKRDRWVPLRDFIPGWRSCNFWMMTAHGGTMPCAHE